MKIKCKTIYNPSSDLIEEELTINKEYEVLGEQHGFAYDMYLIKNDKGELKSYCEMLFYYKQQ